MVVSNRAAMHDALCRQGYSAWCPDGQGPVTWSCAARSKRWAYEDRFGYRGPHGRFILACRLRDGSINHQYKVVAASIILSSNPSINKTAIQSAC